MFDISLHIVVRLHSHFTLPIATYARTAAGDVVRFSSRPLGRDWEEAPLRLHPHLLHASHVDKLRRLNHDLSYGFIGKRSACHS
jgi:hypothetical protein